MQTSSINVHKYTKSITRADNNETFVHKSVLVKAQCDIPPGAETFPQIVTMYSTIHERMDALKKNFHKEGTQNICHGNRISRFLVTLQRARLLNEQLVNKCAKYHISMCKKEHGKDYKIDPNKKPQSSDVLAPLAVQQLIGIFPTDVLEYLDMNRREQEKQLLDVYGPLVAKNTLSPLDLRAIDDAVGCMTSYLKLITVVHYKALHKKLGRRPQKNKSWPKLNVTRPTKKPLLSTKALRKMPLPCHKMQSKWRICSTHY